MLITYKKLQKGLNPDIIWFIWSIGVGYWGTFRTLCKTLNMGSFGKKHPKKSRKNDHNYMLSITFYHSKCCHYLYDIDMCEM